MLKWYFLSNLTAQAHTMFTLPVLLEELVSVPMCAEMHICLDDERANFVLNIQGMLIIQN